MFVSIATHDPQLPSPAQSPTFAERGGNDDAQTRETFNQFFGQTFYGQLIGSMRQSTDKPEYLHGGRAEEIFRGQLDQALADEMTERTAHNLAGPMYDLFTLSRS